MRFSLLFINTGKIFGTSTAGTVSNTLQKQQACTYLFKFLAIFHFRFKHASIQLEGSSTRSDQASVKAAQSSASYSARKRIYSGRGTGANTSKTEQTLQTLCLIQI